MHLSLHFRFRDLAPCINILINVTLKKRTIRTLDINRPNTVHSYFTLNLPGNERTGVS